MKEYFRVCGRLPTAEFELAVARWYGGGMAGGYSPYGNAYTTYGGAAGGPAQLYGSMYGGMQGYGGAGGYGMMPGMAGMTPSATQQSTANQTGGTEGATAGKDQTGTFLASRQSYLAAGVMGPRVIPNISDNSLLIQATRKDY